MSNRSPSDPVKIAIEQHLNAAAELMLVQRKAADPAATIATILERLDSIMTKLGSPAEYPVTWVKLEKYTELTGDSMDSVQSRRQIGRWLDGVQCKIVSGRLWINLPAAQRWIEEWDARAPMRALLTSHRAASQPKK
jgi:hypothetical protein